jgi:S1-C subfamily serine protease
MEGHDTVSSKPFLAFQLVCWLLAVIWAAPAAGQMVMERAVTGGEGVFLLPELAVVLTARDDTLLVEMVLPQHIRPKGYEDLEVRQGDAIPMINRKRVKSVDEFKAVYDSLKPDEEVKLGLRRGQELRLLAFEKVDPEQLAKGGRVLVTTATAGGSPDGAQAGGGLRTKSLTIGGPDGLHPLLGSGMLLRATDEGVTVARLLEGLGEGPGRADVKEGDQITAINGAQVTSLDGLQQSWDEIPVGEEVRLKLRRQGATLSTAFVKPEPQGKIMMRKR